MTTQQDLSVEEDHKRWSKAPEKSSLFDLKFFVKLLCQRAELNFHSEWQHQLSSTLRSAGAVEAQRGTGRGLAQSWTVLWTPLRRWVRGGC